MATITIEAPVLKDLKYIIEDVQTTAELVKKLDAIAVRVKKNSSKIIPPRVPKDEAFQAGVGLLENETESGAEISRRIRENNRKIT